MGVVGAGRLVSLSLDPVLVPAGFLSAQYGEDGAGNGQVIFCAAHDEFSRRHPLLPQANAQQQVGTCVDLVIDVQADGTLGRLDLEGVSVAQTLHHAGLGTDGEEVAGLDGRPIAEGLPVLAAALTRLFGEPGGTLAG